MMLDAPPIMRAVDESVPSQQGLKHVGVQADHDDLAVSMSPFHHNKD